MMELVWDWLLAICHFKNKLKSHGKHLIAVLRIVCFKVDRLPFLSCFDKLEFVIF